VQLNILDLTVGGLILILGLKGILNGMVKEMFGLLGVVGGIYIATSYANDFGAILNRNVYTFEKEEIATLIGFILLLILSWGGIIVLGNVVSKLMKLSSLGMIDKLLGVIFASGKVFVFFAIIAYSLSSIEVIAKSLSKHTEGSILYPILVESGSLIVNIDPDMFSATTLDDKAPTKVDKELLSLEDLQIEIQRRMQESSKQLEKLEQRVNDE